MRLAVDEIHLVIDPSQSKTSIPYADYTIARRNGSLPSEAENLY
jgi:hypothetical protein